MEDQFNAKNLEGLWDYSSAKTLVMFVTACGVDNLQTTSKTY